MAKESLKYFAELQANCGVQLFNQCGCLSLDQGSGSTVELMEKTCKDLGFPHELLTPSDISLKFPQLKVPENFVGIYSPDGGVAFADKIIDCLRQEILKLGVEIVENFTANLKLDLPQIQVLDEKGNCFARVEKAVITSGSWTNHVLSNAGLSEIPGLFVTNEQATYFSPKPGTTLDHTTNGNLPTILLDLGDVGYYYALPQVVGGIAGIKATIHQAGDNLISLDTKDRCQGTNTELLRNVTEYFVPLFPFLEKTPCHVVRCLYTNTVDSKFVVGQHSDDSRVFVATGFCGSGFKHSPMIGRLLSQLMSAQEPEIDISCFSINRFHKSKV
eukprot:TRINITY_DN636_c0_g1_i6.p1 TRINITY_DN636_c0_g1~~TRINITY_DN636_c0_g1_i6.p1  ORF type:complete len:330 (+),score=65.26 TRINITY_DN636_c0_g1_i6:297-1286(+)